MILERFLRDEGLANRYTPANKLNGTNHHETQRPTTRLTPKTSDGRLIE
jgi:hypothetical protein